MIATAFRYLLLAALLPLCASAQVDTLPRFASGQLDWVKFKALAPKFQQKDLVVRIVRFNDMTGVYEREGNANWQNDWHFVEMNGDRLIDGVYSGQTKHHKGWHTYLAMGDTAFRYPILLSAPGYVHSLRADTNGIEMVLRRDPNEKEYITEITHHYYDLHADSARSLWQLRYVSTTEIPPLGNPDAHVLKMPIQLRTTPRQVTEPAIDYDQDGRPDAAGNVVAEFPVGARLRRYAVVREGDLEWSFVVFADAPNAGSVLNPVAHKNAYYAGWIPSAAFKK